MDSNSQQPGEPPVHRDDPRLAPYQDLKGKAFNRQNNLFVVEGDALVRRLIKSPVTVNSILVEDRLAAQYSALIDSDRESDIDIMSASAELLSEIVGYDFHRGILACGQRPDTTINANDALWRNARSVVACPMIHDQENLGLIMRTAAALGADALLVGDKGADPFARRPLRVSMGAAFTLPVFISPNMNDDLKTLRERHGLQLIATTLGPDAIELNDFAPPARFVLLAGSEPDGLTGEIESLCDHRITMAMHRKVDSLNVAVATGIVLHQLSRGQS